MGQEREGKKIESFLLPMRKLKDRHEDDDR